VSEWQPIEAAPKDGTKILMSDKKDVWMGRWADAVVDDELGMLAPARWEDCGEGFECHPTHFMDLPEPPK
jgi:hypothetical protein